MGASSGSREPSPDGLGPSGFDPERTEAIALSLLDRAAKVRSDPLSNFGGGWLASSIREGIAEGFESVAYERCPHLRPLTAGQKWAKWARERLTLSRRFFAINYRNNAQRNSPAIADRNPTGEDAQQTSSRSDESGGAEGNRPKGTP